MNLLEQVLKHLIGQYFCAFGLGLSGAIALQPVVLGAAIALSPDAPSHSPALVQSVAIANASAEPYTSAEPSSAKADKKPRPSQQSTQPSSPDHSTATAPEAAPEVQIRVRVGHHPSQLELATSTPAAVTSTSGNSHGSLQPMTRYAAQVNASGIQIGTFQLENGVLIDPGPEGLVFVNSRWYRGQLYLVYADGELLAVNLVDLEHYLYSVVGSEMPASWHPDALRAQAIAARSYALIHIGRPASSWFDLGDNERWQAYNGIASEAASTHAAVADTTAQVLTQNGQILEAMYAATQEITDRAHDGFGMSQYGAEALANQGHNYQQILANYYPGSAIARLQG